MKSVVSFLALLLVFGVVALVLPVGLAVSATWTAGTTSTIITATAGICGSAVALASLAFGAAVGFRVLGERRRQQVDNGAIAPYHQVPQVYELEPYRQAQLTRLEVQTQRDALKLAAERRSLLEPPRRDGWSVSADWELVDGADGSGGGW